MRGLIRLQALLVTMSLIIHESFSKLPPHECMHDKLAELIPEHSPNEISLEVRKQIEVKFINNSIKILKIYIFEPNFDQIFSLLINQIQEV